MNTMQLALVLLVIFLDHVRFGLVYPMFSSLLFQPESSFVDSGMSTMSKGWFLELLLAAPGITSFLFFIPNRMLYFISSGSSLCQDDGALIELIEFHGK